jgi:LuxR family maltose regulon positive regulatory protein
VEYLDQRRERPLTLISAPAGYGKSVLISSWLETCGSPGAWLSLDEQDNDLHQFLAYLLASVQTIFPDSVSKTAILVNAPTLPPLPVLVSSLTNELDAIEENFILVIDDIHRIQEKSVYQFLKDLLRHAPQPMHLVLLGRKDPRLAFKVFMEQILI